MRANQIPGLTLLHKFGYNFDVDAAEDVWDGGGTYAWPAAAAATTIVSASADDAAAGTGARTVRVIGVDANYLQVTETATLNGTNAVTLTNQFLRVHRCQVMTAGSGGVNAGNIQVKHGSTVLAQITATYGQTLMAIYTIPADFEAAALIGWYATLGRAITSVATVALMVRPFGGAWVTRELIDLSDSAGGWDYKFPVWLDLEPKSDIRVRVTAVSASNTLVSAGFDIAQYDYR